MVANNTSLCFDQLATCDTLNINGYQQSYAYAIPNNAKAAITLVNGRCESYLKYRELANDLIKSGFAVFLYDHLGQGLSSRLISDREKGYIDQFSSYITGLSLFVQHVVKPNWQQQHFLLAHSMGAAISYLYLANHSHPFQRAALCAPMFGIPTNGLPHNVAKLIATISCKIGFAEHYVFGQQAYCDTPFEQNKLMQSEARYARFRTLYQARPELRLGGVTYSWLKHALLAIDAIKTTDISVPTLILQAECDSIVLNDAQSALAKRQPQLTLKRYAHSFHEILFEKDAIRNLALQDICSFFNMGLCE